MTILRGRQGGNFNSCFTDKEVEAQKSRERVSDGTLSSVSGTPTCWGFLARPRVCHQLAESQLYWYPVWILLSLTVICIFFAHKFPHFHSVQGLCMSCSPWLPSHSVSFSILFPNISVSVGWLGPGVSSPLEVFASLSGWISTYRMDGWMHSCV